MPYKLSIVRCPVLIRCSDKVLVWLLVGKVLVRGFFLGAPICVAQALSRSKFDVYRESEMSARGEGERRETRGYEPFERERERGIRLA